MTEGVDTLDFNGKFNNKVDAKGRIAIPATYRKTLGQACQNDEGDAPISVVVTRNLYDECLSVFTVEEFNKWVAQVIADKYGKFDNTNREHAALRRKLKSRARDVDVDSAGRIMLAADQREAVGIAKDAVVVGNTGYFEIWDASKYETMDDSVDFDLLFG